MAKIKAPVPITGLHVTLQFVNGLSETKDAWLIEWFKSHGYEVTEDEPDDGQPEGTEPPTTPPDEDSEGKDTTEPETPVEGQPEGETEKPKSSRRKVNK